MIGDWTVLRTRPRAEKRVAEACRALALAHYLPLRSATRVYQRRKVTFLTPLFPGYVFVELPPGGKAALLGCGRVAQVLRVSRPGEMLRQLVMVRKALAANPELDAAEPVAEGEVVRVASGAMQGCEGVVTRVKRRTGRVVLMISVDIIGRAVPLEVEQALVERQYDARTKAYRRAPGAPQGPGGRKGGA